LTSKTKIKYHTSYWYSR